MSFSRFLVSIAALAVSAGAFQGVLPASSVRRSVASLRAEDDDFQSELDRAMGIAVDDDDKPETVPEVVKRAGTSREAKPAATRAENVSFLQSLGAITGRGEFASDPQKSAAESVAAALEAEATEIDSSLLPGRWELVFSDTFLFRGSPFFLAGRAACTTDRQRDQYDWFCDVHRKALAISTVGPVRQVISAGGRLVSEFEVRAGAVPFLNDFTPLSYSGGLPFVATGAIVSSADWTSLPNGDLELFMDTVEIKGSNIPGVRQVLDAGLKLQSRDLGGFLQENLDGYSNPRPVFKTTYLTDKFRIARDQDDHVFVYVKTSDDGTPTDYSGVTSDLGVTELIEGFNDAVTKFYL